MQIGTIAKKIGLSIDAIRFYERNSLSNQPNLDFTVWERRRVPIRCTVDPLRFCR